MAKRTANGLNEIRKLINVEEKHLTIAGSTTFDRSGQIVYLSGLAQGDGSSEREGVSLKVQRFHLKFYLYFNTAATIGTGCRILLIRDLQNAGAAPALSDILESPAAALTAPVTAINYLNGQYANKRFSIVMDELVTLDAGWQSKAFDFTSNHDCHVYYRGTTSAIGSAGNGSYFLVAVSSEATNLPVIVYSSRMLFTDN